MICVDSGLPCSEILIAELAEVGFDSFVDTPTGIKAYIPKDSWNEQILEDIYLLGNLAPE